MPAGIAYRFSYNVRPRNASGAAMPIVRMSDLDLRGKRVLIREDLNVPIKDGQVASEQRISGALGKNGARIVAGPAPTGKRGSCRRSSLGRGRRPRGPA